MSKRNASIGDYPIHSENLLPASMRVGCGNYLEYIASACLDTEERSMEDSSSVYSTARLAHHFARTADKSYILIG